MSSNRLDVEEACPVFKADTSLVGVKPFTSSIEHLLAELERLDLMVQSRVRAARKQHVADPEFQGLCISETEVDSLLARPCGLPHWAQPNSGDEEVSIQDALARLRELIDQRAKESLLGGIRLRLEELSTLFSLDERDRDILLVCLAPEMDLRYEKLFAYLQDDVTKKRPSVDLVLNLLCPTFAQKMQARRRFLPGSKLLEEQLMQLFVDASQPEPPLLRKYCKLDERVVSFLLESDSLAEPLRTFASFKQTNAGWEGVLLPEGVQERLSAFAKHRLDQGQSSVFYFQGAPGAGRLAAAKALCREAGCALLVVDGHQVLERAAAELASLAQLAVREALLSCAAIYWEDFELLLEPDKASALAGLLRRLDGTVPLVFLAGQAAWEPWIDQLPRSAFIRLEFPALKDDADRRVFWEQFLPATRRAPEVDLGVLSTRFRLNPGAIAAAVKTAQNLASWRDPADGIIGMNDLFAACRLQSHSKLAGLARKIELKYRLEDIILPPDQLEQLREILAQARLRHIVLGEWGFARKLSLGKGLNVLFSGPPGTGKTMAAEVIANELGLDLYKIDLSQVVSKYIGETEKNLDRIFREAHGSNAILFFDEADSLFGKRCEVKDAHDRYANIEIGYLLQKMEEYEGIAILATNLRQNLDEAFVRRLHVIVEFPFPDEEYRRRIWQLVFPDKAPTGEDVDFDFLARDIRLAGGNIKNIALAAAFQAARNGKVITMPHLVEASRREHQKLGRIWTEGERKLRNIEDV